MGWLKDSREDLKRLKSVYEMNPLLAILANRGFHALFVYRLCNRLYRWRIPLVPLILTRIIQILYSIDIDYKASIQGGVIIIHGVGLVIGEGATVASETIFYHGVTLGRKRQGKRLCAGDGFPTVDRRCVLGAGAKLIGPIKIGENVVIGPNCVITHDVPAGSLIKINEQSYSIKKI